MKSKNCIVLASDSNYAALARNCIQSLGAVAEFEADIKFVGIRLPPDEIGWLRGRGIDVLEDTSRIRRANGLPEYSVAQTCRPFLRELFPGYETYLWIDSDVKVLRREALELYFRFAGANPEGGAFALECDPSYIFIKNPLNGYANSGRRFERVRKVVPADIAKLFAISLQFNSGLFAMKRESRVWDKYQHWVNRLLDRQCFTHMSDQDALNLALLDAPANIANPGACLNWICSAALPRFDRERRVWTRPDYPFHEILVAHLTQCSTFVDSERKTTFLEAYRQLGLVTEAAAKPAE